MYGVPADLDLGFLVGQELQQICIGWYDIQFHFDGGGDVASVGEWTLLDGDGVVVDRRQEHSERAQYRIHRLLHHKIRAFEVAAPVSFDLVFDDGHVLRFIDGDPQFESVTIWPAGIVI